MQNWLIGTGTWFWLLRLPLIAYLTLGGYAYFLSDRQIFLPQLAGNAALPVPPLRLQTQDGGTIAALHLTHASAQYTVLYSHGNAETLGDIYPRLQQVRDLGFNILAYDYRGYGQSSGTPSEQAAYRDIEAAYRYLTQTLQVSSGQILVLGRSVGGGPATYLAEQHPVAGLILESTFTSIFRVVLPVRILPFDKFPNRDRLSHIRVPVLILHGTQDRVVPFAHGQALYAAARVPKTLVAIPGADHNDVIAVGGDRYEQALQDFAASLR
jgi:hypothetical protein